MQRRKKAMWWFPREEDEEKEQSASYKQCLLLGLVLSPEVFNHSAESFYVLI